MKTILPAIAIILSIASLVVSLWPEEKEIEPWKQDIGTAEPTQVVRAIFETNTNSGAFQAESAYRVANRDEIMRTVEVAETSISGDYGILFARYSVGTETFHEAYWIAKINNKWYWHPSLKYAKRTPKDRDWVDQMSEKKEKWLREAPSNFRAR